MRLVLAVLLALALAAPVVAKGQPQQVSFFTENDFRQQYLDHQGTYPDGDPASWVRNTTSCVWNDQDSLFRVGSGYVEGAVSDGMCLIADLDETSGANRPHSVYVNVYAAADTLRVELSNDAGDSWTAGPSVAHGNLRLWRLCVRDPVADEANSRDLTIWPEVPGTNGGRGQRVEYTLTVTSLARRARDVTAHWEIAGTGPTWAAPRAITDCP